LYNNGETVVLQSRSINDIKRDLLQESLPSSPSPTKKRRIGGKRKQNSKRKLKNKKNKKTKKQKKRPTCFGHCHFLN
jgi:hypothetical protein